MKTHKTRKWTRAGIASLGALWLGMSTPSYAATFVVDSTADAPDATSGDGLCADSQGRCTLRAAIMQANALSGADVIDLSGINDPANPIILSIPGVDETAEGTASGGYTAVASHDASIGDLNITDSLTITGAGSGLTIIGWDPSVKTDAANGDRIFHVEAVSSNIDVTISGVTIQNGVIPPPEILRTLPDGTYYQLKRNGAGIAIGPAAAVSLVDPNAPSGDSGSGGGGGSGGDEGETTAAITSMTLSDVNILNNQSGGDGGGVYNAAPLTLSNATVSGNTAVANGGGIYNDAAMTLTDSTIGTKTGFATPNTAEGGGGIFDTGLHTTTISGTTISGNTAVGGGGISARSIVTINITNSTIVGNTATDVGGAITTNGTVNLKNSTVADNSFSADSSGGGAALNSFGQGTYNFVNTLFNNNQKTGTTTAVTTCGCSGGTSCSAGLMVSGGHNLADDNSCTLSGTGDKPDTVSALVALAGNGGNTETRALLQDDPAVDAGDDANCPNGDQRGSIRPADGNLNNVAACDIGAFELFIDRADLHGSKSNAPNAVARGKSADFTAEFTNSSTSDATGVTVTTSAVPSSYTFTGATLATPEGTSTCTMDAGTRVVSCVAPGTQTLAAGQTATFAIQGTGNATGKVSITATIAATAPVDTYPDNNAVTVNILIQGTSNLAVTGSATASKVNRNASTSLNFKVQNTGADPATNVRFVAQLSNKLTFKSVTSSAGTCGLQSDNVTVLCELGDMASGASITGTLDVTGTTEGDADVVFQAATDDIDTDPTNDRSVVALTVAAVPTTSDSGGGGCVMRSGNGFVDPTLPALIVSGLLGIALRRRIAARAEPPK